MNNNGIFQRPLGPRDMQQWACPSLEDASPSDTVNDKDWQRETAAKQDSQQNSRWPCVSTPQPVTREQPIPPSSMTASAPSMASKPRDGVGSKRAGKSVKDDMAAAGGLMTNQLQQPQPQQVISPPWPALKPQQPCQNQPSDCQTHYASPDVPCHACPRDANMNNPKFPVQSRVPQVNPRPSSQPLDRSQGCYGPPPTAQVRMPQGDAIQRSQFQSQKRLPQAPPNNRPVPAPYRPPLPSACQQPPPQQIALPNPGVFQRPPTHTQTSLAQTGSCQRPQLQTRLPQPGACPAPVPQAQYGMPQVATSLTPPPQPQSRLPQPGVHQRPASQPQNRLPQPSLTHVPSSQPGARFPSTGLNPPPPSQPFTRFPPPVFSNKPSLPPFPVTHLNSSGHVLDPSISSQQVFNKPQNTEAERVVDVSSTASESDDTQLLDNQLFGLGDQDDRLFVQLGELMFGDKDERIFKQRDLSFRMFGLDQESLWKWRISPDRRTNYSFDGSYVSDSLSSRADTDTSSRGTPVSWESQSQGQSGKECDPNGDFDLRLNSSRLPTDEQDSTIISDTASSRDGFWDYDFEENQLSMDHCHDSGSDGKRHYSDVQRQQDRYSYGLGHDSEDRSSSLGACCDYTHKTGCKRHRDDSCYFDLDLDSDIRAWRFVKRLRPDSQELKNLVEDLTSDPLPEDDTPSWTRSSPADLYFIRNTEGVLEASQKMKDLENLFEEDIVKRAEKARKAAASTESSTSASRQHRRHVHHCHHRSSSSGSSSNTSSSESDSDDGGTCNSWMEEMDRKRKHPQSLHPELWYNDPGEMNNGPLCRCSLKAQRSGIRHDIYPGEKFIEPCNPASNNIQNLHHYRITMSPSTNFLTNSPTVIEFDNHEFIFEGFSLFTHEKLDNVPLCKVIRFHIEYTIHFIEEQVPESFTIRSLDLITQFLFREILELVDLKWTGRDGGCSPVHVMPRFARSLPENGKEVLSMNEVLKFLLRSSRPLVKESDLPNIQKLDKEEWQAWIDLVCGMIVTYPGKKPSSIRVDQLDRTKLLEGEMTPPILVHFGIRPAQLSYAGDPTYQKAWKQYIKFKHLLNSKPKVSREDKMKLKLKEAQLQELQRKTSMKREVTVELSSEGFMRTGLKSDICQHALLLPVLISHIRFHSCLAVLEEHLQYTFQDRTLLQLALTHTSFRSNYGTNPAHARNSLTNCGLRQVEYGDRRVYYQNTRKRGINILVDIMSRMGRKEETPSDIPHNERLEFLGDAVVEFLSSVHLFYMFPWLEEGGLSTYRTAIVQNQHLAVLAKNLRLQDFMLFVHGPDLCHESDLRHAMANCFEALMGALFLDGGLDVVDQVFGRTLFEDDEKCLRTWMDLPLHPLQEDEPGDDRHWVESSPALQKLVAFEERTGVTFTHVRLLAKAFTHRNVGYNILTMGHNQRLEFLGDTVLQLIASEYLYKHFPEHHEGHLSLLRSSLVNSRTQAIVCDDLGMLDFVIYSSAGSDKFDMKTKQKADLLESFLGALYVDSGMEFCKAFTDICFFPRLKDFILNQDWNDPKSQLQQCCLTLRKMGGGEPDIPIYKVIESLGPSNTRKYVVAVYFRGERLATGTGHSIQQSEMSAATNALRMRAELFPILQHQRRFLERRYRGREWNYRSCQYRPHYAHSYRGPWSAVPSSTTSSSSLGNRQT